MRFIELTKKGGRDVVWVRVDQVQAVERYKDDRTVVVMASGESFSVTDLPGEIFKKMGMQL